ncbi:hypothetical protein Q7F20_07600 [Curtobacterium sp. A7_M15]|uniref:hypothetical protein n=1 Tax=Curtobacterium sp. A7_M15 TaxID=3065241 RepID=UPI002737D516|nr:hypothetical protein [Curtobacterium sp. A7_M15]MDP4333233.1 hypothetical protein [Curtobacterium sp. A7_M15]
MAGGFSVSIGSDTRLFEQGVKVGVIAPVEDAQDALQDLANTSTSRLDRGLDDLSKAGKDVGDDIRDGSKKAERALDDLGDAGKDAGNDLEAGLKDAQSETSKTTADYKEMAEKIRAETAKIKAQSKEDFNGAGGATGEFKEEALSNFSEVTSSFTGDMQSITDLAQGTFGGLASLGGPASLVFGGIAVAVGLIGQAFATSGEESDEFKEKIQDLAQTKLEDLFGQYEDSGDDLARGLRKWATDADSFGGSLTDLQKNARKAGLGVGELTAAIGSQSVSKMRALRTEVDKQIDSLQKQAATLSDGTAKGRIAAKGAQEQADAAREVRKQLDQNLKVNDAYEESVRAVAKAQGQTVKQYLATVDAQAKAEEANQKLEDSMKSLAEQSGESTAELVDNSSLGANNYIAGMEKRQAADDQYYSNLQAVGKAVPDSVYQYLQGQGEAFSQELATYLSATPEQQARILDGWKKAAGSGTDIDGPTVKAKGDTSDVDRKTAEKGKEKKAGPTSKLQPDTKDLDAKVREKGGQKSKGPTMAFQSDTSDVDRAISSLKKKTFSGPTAVFQVDRSSVNNTIANLRNTTITVKVKAVDG